VSLATPPKLRRLQEALYTKAKQEPAYRFYLLYDKVYRADILAHAYRLAKQNGGAPGVDGVTFEDIETGGVERWLAAVGEALRTGTYRAQPVRRVLIPKPGGTGERPLGVPTIIANCGVVQYAFGVPDRDAPVPPVGGAAAADPLRASSIDRSHLYL
jgi:RNA-directed DNA polymerase